MTDSLADSRQAGAEIEVTPAMVEAGVLALASLCPLDVAFPVGGEQDAVRAVILAAHQSGMCRERPQTR